MSFRFVLLLLSLSLSLCTHTHFVQKILSLTQISYLFYTFHICMGFTGTEIKDIKLKKINLDF